MTAMQTAIVQERTWNTLQTRIEGLTQAKIRLFTEWRQAIRRAYCAPDPQCYDALQAVVKRYTELADAVEVHITTLEACRKAFIPA